VTNAVKYAGASGDAGLVELSARCSEDLRIVQEGEGTEVRMRFPLATG
jgi:two-component sensor histidine kinase